METVSLHELKRLAEVNGSGAVSIYLPTIGTGPEEAQDLVRWNSLVDHAAGYSYVAGSPAEASLRAIPKNPSVWKHRRRGLAVFAWGEECRVVHTTTPFAQSVMVDTRLNVKPLLGIADLGHWFHLLIASKRHTHLFKVSRERIDSIDVAGFPERMEDVLNIDSTDRGQQVHEGARGGAGKQGAVFHGQGGTRDASKQDLAQYFHAVDRALHPVLNGKAAPLVLACVDYEVPIYRAANTYPHLVDEHLEGNFDRKSTQELHDRSWALMSPRFDRPRREALERVAALAGTGKGASEVTQIVKGALEGRVQVLLADPSATLTGEFDPKKALASVGEAHGAGQELVNLAISETLRHGGEVHAVKATELPDRSPLAAVFRY